MLSLVPVKYNAGQGALIRFSALFTTGVANSRQIAGVGEVGDGLFFGFNGSVFSILRREAGVPEVQILTITAGATVASGNITITLDGVSKIVAVTLNDSAREVAVKIADADYSDIGLGWSATVNNSSVIFKSWSDGDKTGTFSLVDTDTTGVAGTFSETISGATTINNWIAQSSWNTDKFDGTGASGVVLDPTKGNVYQIQYQWLGFGTLSFFIENPNTGGFCLVHRIKFANANIIPSLRNPTLPLHMAAQNITNTSDLIIKTSSIGGFIEGKVPNGALHFSEDNNIITLGTTELPILSIKNKVVYQNIINRVIISPGFVSGAAESTKPIIIRFRTNPTLTGPVAFSDVNTNSSVSSVDKAATGITGGIVVFSATLGKNENDIFDFHPLELKIMPGDIMCISAEATGGANQEITVSLVWAEFE